MEFTVNDIILTLCLYKEQGISPDQIDYTRQSGMPRSLLLKNGTRATLNLSLTNWKRECLDKYNIPLDFEVPLAQSVENIKSQIYELMSQQQETFILYGLMALAVIATIQIILTCGQCCLTSWVYKKGVKSTVQKKSPSPSEQRPKKAARKSQVTADDDDHQPPIIVTQGGCKPKTRSVMAYRTNCDDDVEWMDYPFTTGSRRMCSLPRLQMRNMNDTGVMFHTQDSTQRQLNYWMSKSEEQEDRLKAYKARMKREAKSKITEQMDKEIQAKLKTDESEGSDEV